MSFVHESDEKTLHEREIRSFIARYGTDIDPNHIENVYRDRLAYYESAPIRSFIPIIVSREVEEALSELKKQK